MIITTLLQHKKKITGATTNLAYTVLINMPCFLTELVKSWLETSDFSFELLRNYDVMKTFRITVVYFAAYHDFSVLNSSENMWAQDKNILHLTECFIIEAFLKHTVLRKCNTE